MVALTSFFRSHLQSNRVEALIVMIGVTPQ
jgi:hypothetical protein